MDDMFRWIFGILIGALTAMGGWIINELRGKANKSSTDDRFKQMIARLDKHFDECREDKKELNDKLTEIHADIAETKTAVAVIAAKNGAKNGSDG